LKLAVICAVLAACATFAYAGDERAAQPVAPVSPAVIAASTTLVAPASSSLPDAPTATLTMSPAPPAAIIKLKPRPTEHRFFDPTNALALSSLAAGLTADALSTQKGLSYPGFYEMNPLARPFVSSRSGAAAYSAASFGLLAGGMYLAHRKGHHKLERILPFAVAGWEGLLGARNYHVISQNTR
jgi:hypothetical protein